MLILLAEECMFQKAHDPYAWLKLLCPVLNGTAKGVRSVTSLTADERNAITFTDVKLSLLTTI